MESRIWDLVASFSPLAKPFADLLYIAVQLFVLKNNLNIADIADPDPNSFFNNYRPIAGHLFRIYATAFSK